MTEDKRATEAEENRHQKKTQVENTSSSWSFNCCTVRKCIQRKRDRDRCRECVWKKTLTTNFQGQRRRSLGAQNATMNAVECLF